MDWKQKLGSRKLWACVAGVVMGAAMLFGLEESTISTVAGAVTSLGSIIAYVMTEGKVDAAAVRSVYRTVYTVAGTEDAALQQEVL